MPGSSRYTIYIGNLDERVSDRVLYDILIQAGRVVELHIPRDRETGRPKGFAFAEYETEEIADYAVKLFSGLVTLYNRTLKFAISGQDKPLPNHSNENVSESNLNNKSRLHIVTSNNVEYAHQSMRLSAPCPVNYSHEPPPPSVTHNSNGNGSLFNGVNYDYDQRDYGSTFDSTSRSRSRR